MLSSCSPNSVNIIVDKSNSSIVILYSVSEIDILESPFFSQVTCKVDACTSLDAGVQEHGTPTGNEIGRCRKP